MPPYKPMVGHMRGSEIPGSGPILARFCSDPDLPQDKAPNSGPYGPLGDHSYHITNVREDATIPQFEQPSWKQLNTFRTNSQISGGKVCDPVPQ